MKLSENLLKLRLEHNFTQDALAKALNISPRAYQNYERGARLPLLPTLIAMADLYDISLDELVCREFPQPEEKEERTWPT